MLRKKIKVKELLEEFLHQIYSMMQKLFLSLHPVVKYVIHLQ